MVDGTAIALASIRFVSYVMLGWSMFYLAMSLGKWYEAEIMTDELEFKLHGDLEIRSSYSQRFLFIGMPIVLAAALGGLYEAIWKRRELRASRAATGPEDGDDSEIEGDGVFNLLHGIIHYKFRPLGQYSP